ncbi:MAG: YsnF/AvaK domain-containing protein [Persicimonas sp.]
MAKSTIVGLFDDDKSVHNIEKGLEKRGIKRGEFQTLNWKDVSKGKDPWGIGKSQQKDEDAGDRLIDELKSRGVPDDDAHYFAKAVREGGNLLVTELEDDTKTEEVARYLDENGAVDIDDRRRGQSTTIGEGREYERELSSGEEARLQEAREELHVGKRDIEKGRVRVHKRVEEKPVEEDINLREEHAEVERHKVDRPVSGEDPFEEETFEVTEHAEEPVVEKETRIEEEVRVGKHVDEHTETVRDTVRETHIDIDELSEDIPEERGFTAAEPEYRQHYQSSFAESEGDYADYEPGYRFGHTVGSSERFSGQDYSELEPNIRKAYEREYGEGSYERYHDAVRHGFNKARGRRRA